MLFQYIKQLSEQIQKKSLLLKKLKSTRINFDKSGLSDTAHSDEEDLDTGDHNYQAKVKFKQLDAKLCSCQRCGPNAYCCIDAQNKHNNNITVQMVRFWGNAWVFPVHVSSVLC